MPKTWERYPSVCRDIEAAERVLQEFGEVTPRQWAALLWKWTNIPTAPCNGHSVAAPLVDAASRRTEIGYYPAAHLAKADHVWSLAFGTKMLEWVELLSEEKTRQMAWNYAKGEYHSNKFEFQPRVKRVAQQMALPSPPENTDSRKDRPILLPGQVALTEPPQEFAKEMERLNSPEEVERLTEKMRRRNENPVDELLGEIESVPPGLTLVSTR